MKQIEKQSMKALVQFALDMPVADLDQYGQLFLSGPVPTKMTRGELIALQLVHRASYGDLDAMKEIRSWVAEEKKEAPVGGTTYYQFLVNLSGGKAPEEIAPQTAKGLQELAKKIGKKTIPVTAVLDDL